MIFLRSLDLRIKLLPHWQLLVFLEYIWKGMWRSTTAKRIVCTVKSPVLRNAVVCKHHRTQHWAHFTTLPGWNHYTQLHTMALLQVINVNTSVSLFHQNVFFHLWWVMFYTLNTAAGITVPLASHLLSSFTPFILAVLLAVSTYILYKWCSLSSILPILEDVARTCPFAFP